MTKQTVTDNEIHNLIIAKNDMALSKLFDMYGESVMVSLKQWYPKIAFTDYSMIISAVNEAFFGYYQNPNTYNSKLNKLLRFLEIAAERDLLNAIRKEKKHRENQINLPADVEFLEKIWNSSMEKLDNAQSELIQKELLTKVDSFLKDYFLNNIDIHLAKLVLLKERKNQVFIEILGIDKLSKEEQVSTVKRNKDRIKKVIERHDLENKIKGLLL